MMEYCKFVLIFAIVMSVGFFSPKPLNDPTVNLDLNESPKGFGIVVDELKTKMKMTKTSGPGGCYKIQKLDKPRRRKTRLLNGIDVPEIPRVGEPPWLKWIVSIKTDAINPETGLQECANCGGVLISRKHVLTALHCVSTSIDPSVTSTGLVTGLLLPVKPEEVQIFVNSLRFQQGVVFGAREIFHKNNSEFYNPLTNEYAFVDDIALIKLKREIPTNIPVTPISLPIRPPRDDDDYWMAGWGASQTKPQWVYPVNLKQFLFLQKDKADCYDVPNELLRPVDKYLCFNNFNFNTTVRGACKGDSGSPGIIFDRSLDKTKWYLQGINSATEPGVLGGYAGCNETHSYGLDINVWHYKDDILEWMEK